MGLFGKIFEKKECAICGGEIGLLGNRKLEDGNMCKNCAALLSPWMTDRRQSTVEEIKRHLEYREQNRRALDSIRPTKVLGGNIKVYIDEPQGKFFVTGASDWHARNPDILDISQVISCDLDIKEDKREILRTNNEGKKVSYNPPRYNYSYRFMITIQVNSPWFSVMEFELTTDRPDSPYTEAYREYQREADELQRALKPAQGGYARQAAGGYAQPTAASVPPAPQAVGKWFCPECGTANEGKFCLNCGTKRPESRRTIRCDKCGWTPSDPNSVPKFCPECGDPINERDLT